MSNSNELQKDEAKVIPQKVIEMAEFIKECENNNCIPVIIQKRRWGRTAAIRLAKQTEDIPHELIEPLQLPDKKTNEQ